MSYRAVSSPPAFTPSAVAAAWSGISGHVLRSTFLLGCGLYVVHMGSGMVLGGGLRVALLIFVADQIKAFALMLAITVADHISGRTGDRRGIYLLAVLAGGAVGTVVGVTLAAAMSDRFSVSEHVTIGMILYIYLDLVLIGGAAMWVINDRRRATLARARMHRAELERVEAAQRSVEADLQAMQARVDPRFLFDTLEAVRRLYASDPASGERMLDELIAYLQAAMPKMRAKSSTIGQEIELVRSYLQIWRIHLGARLEFRLESPEEFADVPLPPMMLLPLVNHAIARCRVDAAGSRSLTIRAFGPDGRVRIEIDDTGPGFVPGADDGAITAVRERLSALFGDEARLVFAHAGAGGSRALIDLPQR